MPSRPPTTPSALYSTSPENFRGSTSSNPPHISASPTGYRSPSGTSHQSSSLSGALDNNAYPSYRRLSQTPIGYRSSDASSPASAGLQYRAMNDNQMGDDPRLYRVSDVSLRDPQGATENTSTPSDILLPGFCYIDPPHEGTTWGSAADPRYSPTSVGLSRHPHEQRRYTMEGAAGPSQTTIDSQSYTQGSWPTGGMSYGIVHSSSQQQQQGTRYHDRSDTYQSGGGQ